MKSLTELKKEKQAIEDQINKIERDFPGSTLTELRQEYGAAKNYDATIPITMTFDVEMSLEVIDDDDGGLYADVMGHNSVEDMDDLVDWAVGKSKLVDKKRLNAVNQFKRFQKKIKEIASKHNMTYDDLMDLIKNG